MKLQELILLYSRMYINNLLEADTDITDLE